MAEQIGLFEKQSIFQNKTENEQYLTKQLITYLGNKRSLLDFIGSGVDIVKGELNKDKLSILDLFSGSGVVSRYFKQHSSKLIANDLEDYAYVINKCYLANKSEIDFKEINTHYEYILKRLKEGYKEGFIAEMYAPKDESNITLEDRVFYTKRNAQYIDTVRQIIEEIPKDYRHFFIAPLLSEASIKNNTSGVFKGFYKNSKTGLGEFGGNGGNALSRIKSDIILLKPILSNFECKTQIYKQDANKLIHDLEEVDLVYMDPPYNQHPYGSNYFMLNIINSYKKPTEVSRVSGIPKHWNRSDYNKTRKAKAALHQLCSDVKAKYILVSFNSEGFISKDDMLEVLEDIGDVRIMEKTYNTFRGSRNLRGRSIHVKEYLYLVRKK